MKTPLNILVVEDQLEDSFFLRRAFERAGIPIELHSLGDGAAAVEHLRQLLQGAPASLPQLVLLDLDLPRRSGFEVLAWIRQQPRLAHLRVVIFTGSEDEQNRLLAQRLGADAYLVKPHSLDDLLRIVGRFKAEWLTLDQAKGREAA
jgi:CheY-like chemotaxis protein